MVNRTINQLDNVLDQMRALVASYDITVVTAQAPRRKPRFVPQNENGIIIVDYISVLNNRTRENA